MHGDVITINNVINSDDVIVINIDDVIVINNDNIIVINGNSIIMHFCLPGPSF